MQDKFLSERDVMNIDVLQKRIRLPELRKKVTSAEAAAEHVKDGMTVGMSGFTLAGCVKSVPHAIARKAATQPLKISLLTGASLGNDVEVKDYVEEVRSNNSSRYEQASREKMSALLQ